VKDVSVQGDRKGLGPIFHDMAQLTAIQLNSLPLSSSCQIVPGHRHCPTPFPRETGLGEWQLARAKTMPGPTKGMMHKSTHPRTVQFTCIDII